MPSSYWATALRCQSDARWWPNEYQLQICLLKSTISGRSECFSVSVQNLKKPYNIQNVLWTVGINLYLQMVVLIVIGQYSLGFGLTISSMVVLMICNSFEDIYRMGFTAWHKMHPVVVTSEGYTRLTYEAECGQHVVSGFLKLLVEETVIGYHGWNCLCVMCLL